ncbi:type II toxin-antitoxin system Phd/YefM family antitoxin [Wenzhouxiangella sediminis]|uniref:Type II toxin-antitoxin system Phd/YefM family antitoxin n=1 Tax=Wenzhouxiangella sediminis TaxID=1792836 RepID=A0A3E1K7T1_9GAMM|nr:type II toxin-antitoxin system Phd/YefM family antitoxin [Wenzhouxiangella sediminis]RFF30110.1 type II toxin-antitoxin system Phd/YefM family antitoxin [Wenzhouxiangella sediminis]
MKTEISKTHFKAHALKIFRRLEKTGEPLIVTDRGRPALIVRKYTRPMPDPLMRLRGSVKRYEQPFEPVGQDEWEALE